jgi:hypothetical protein
VRLRSWWCSVRIRASLYTHGPGSRQAFTAYWTRIVADATVIVKTIVFEGHVVGSKPEVS